MNSLFITYSSSWSEYPFFMSLHPRGSALFVLGPTIVMLLRIFLTIVTFTVPLLRQRSMRDMYNKIVVVPQCHSHNISQRTAPNQSTAHLPKEAYLYPAHLPKEADPIRPNEDTTSLTMDWPELQRNSRTQLPVQHTYNWESVDDVHTPHKSAPTSRLGKSGNKLIPRRGPLINISMRGQNRAGSAKNNVLNNGARQNRCPVSTVATEVCETPEYSMEVHMMRRRDSTFQHAERMLGSTSTAPPTPPSPRYHHVNQYINEESMRHLSTALDDFARKKVRN